MRYDPHLPFLKKGIFGPAKSFRAFTLVEVTLSIGIVSFVILVMLGINSVGISTLGDANNANLEAQIIQAISNEAALTDFSNLTNLAGTRYYDQEGRQVPQTSSIYATVISGTTLSCNSVADFNAANIQQLTVKFYHSPGGQINPVSLPFSRRSVTVANSERDSSVGN